ncbi:MAG: chemotaxis protein [Phycisphaerales bacterium]
MSVGQSEMNVSGEILLEAGTNELEVLVFRMAGGAFGVNVAKVREVIKPVRLHASPHKHPSVLGMFNMRGHVLPVVDLGGHLKLRGMMDAADLEGQIIIMEFNGLRTGFVVDAVEQIHRLSWSKVEPAPDLWIGGDSDVASVTDEHGNRRHISSTTGTVQMGDRLILMLDFESVADEILMERRLHIGAVEKGADVDRGSKRVIMAEDSPFMRNLMHDVLKASGYERLEVFSDGLAAWEAIDAIAGDASAQRIDAIISDIEMPRMDGLALTKRVKSDPRLKGVPVVLFSSLVSEDNRKKGQQVGADVQMPKPELAEIVKMVDRVCAGIGVGGEEPVRLKVG